LNGWLLKANILLPIQLLLELGNEEFAPPLNIYDRSRHGCLVKPQVGTISDIIPHQFPVPKGVLEHADGVNLIFNWVKLKMVICKICELVRVLIRYFKIIQRELVHGLFWIPLLE